MLKMLIKSTVIITLLALTLSFTACNNNEPPPDWQTRPTAIVTPSQALERLTEITELSEGSFASVSSELTEAITAGRVQLSGFKFQSSVAWNKPVEFFFVTRLGNVFYHLYDDYSFDIPVVYEYENGVLTLFEEGEAEPVPPAPIAATIPEQEETPPEVTTALEIIYEPAPIETEITEDGA
jgi:hypothetical protein